MSIPNVTVVTAVYDLTAFNSKARSLDVAIKNVTSLLNAPIYLNIFCDSISYEMIREIREKSGLIKLTKINMVPLNQLWCYQFIDKVKLNREKYWPTRDERTCSETHLLVCNKLDFLETTIKSNPFNTTKFMWADAHLEKFCQNYTPDKLLNALDYVREDKFHIEILNVVDKNLYNDLSEYYKQYRWLVCGCFCGGGVEPTIKIINSFKEEFVRTTESGYGHAEEMVYLPLLDKHYDIIQRSYGDYGEIINNFDGVKLNLDYVYNIFERFHGFGYKKEVSDLGEHLIHQFKNRKLHYPTDKMFTVYFYTYINLYYCDREKAASVAKELRSLIQTNPLFEIEYNKNSILYDTQLKFIE